MKRPLLIPTLVLLGGVAIAQSPAVPAAQDPPAKRLFVREGTIQPVCDKKPDQGKAGGKKASANFCGLPSLPMYPAEAKAKHIQGAVHLRAVIGVDGIVKAVRVVDGDPLLGPAAVDAVRQWHYRPYQQDGHPVEVETSITVNFTLAGG